MPSKRKNKPPRTATTTITAWSRLDATRQQQISATADRLLLLSHDDDDWKEIAIAELQLVLILDETKLPQTHDEIKHLLAELDWQTQQATKVFHLLDTHQKSCIVAQDLLTHDLDDNIDPQNAMEMIQEFATNDDDEDILTLHDIIRIARLVHLE